MINAELSGIGAFSGAVAGLLEAVETPDFQGDFTGSLMKELRVAFMVDATAASGSPSMKHMFDWGDNQSDSSSKPLFTLVRNGDVLTFRFLPSTKPVPLPEPSRYGFNPNKLNYMNRHVFRMKALIMETQSSVQISPKQSRALFIPTSDSKYGYVMTTKTVTINPGGPQATGGFARFWNAWFSSKAQTIATSFSRAAEQTIAKTGQSVIRYAAGTKINGSSVGGQFASGRSVKIAYANAKATAETRAKHTLKKKYNGGM